MNEWESANDGRAPSSLAAAYHLASNHQIWVFFQPTLGFVPVAVGVWLIGASKLFSPDRFRDTYYYDAGRTAGAGGGAGRTEQTKTQKPKHDVPVTHYE